MSSGKQVVEHVHADVVALLDDPDSVTATVNGWGGYDYELTRPAAGAAVRIVRTLPGDVALRVVRFDEASLVRDCDCRLSRVAESAVAVLVVAMLGV